MQGETTNPNASPAKANRPVPRFVIQDEHWAKSFLSSLKDFLTEKPARLPQDTRGRIFSYDPGFGTGFLENLKDFLTERPVKVPRGAVDRVFSDPGFGASLLENLKEWLSGTPVYARRAPAYSRMLVEAKPWHRAFWENLRDAVAPPKLPPLLLTSKPVRVRDIWSRNEQFRRLQALSFVMHALVAVVLIVPILYEVTQPTQAQTIKLDEVIDISPYLAQLPPGKDKAGGGGGGGERLPTPPTKGRLPKFSMQPLTPPMAVIRNPNPKLAADPAVLVPPEIRVPNPPLANYGDTLAQLITNSGGPGGGGGIGTGCCGGVGSGEGPGVGPGWGGGIGGGAFRPGTGGIGYPECAYCPNPLYSEQARKAKFQGTVLLRCIVTADGRATNIEVVKSPGLGLEEKALEAVRTWRFKPATGPGGKPVPVWVTIEVTFRLL